MKVFVLCLMLWFPGIEDASAFNDPIETDSFSTLTECHEELSILHNALHIDNALFITLCKQVTVV